MKIAILGSGGWGTALGMLLVRGGNEVCLWSAFEKEIETIKKTGENPLLKGVKIPDEMQLTSDMEQALKSADAVVIAVPSHVVKHVCEQMKAYTVPALVICVAKGFEEDSLTRLSVVIENTLGISDVVVLSGPTHAEEVARGVPTAIVAACGNLKKAEQVQDLFMSPVFRVYTNPDVAGVEVSGALKNVIALCAGISDGIGFGDNTKAALMTRGMAEIIRLGKAMGGKAETFAGLTGIGDLIVTCTSMHSRNRRAGILIGKGENADEAKKDVGMVVEGIKTCKSAYQLAKKYGVEMPIVQTAYEVLYNGKNPKDAVYSLMMRDKKQE